MLIILILIIFIIGFVFGYFTFSIISSKNKSSKDLKEELRVVKHEMEQYKQDVADHFSCTTKLINQISRIKKCKFFFGSIKQFRFITMQNR